MESRMSTPNADDEMTNLVDKLRALDAAFAAAAPASSERAAILDRIAATHDRLDRLVHRMYARSA